MDESSFQDALASVARLHILDAAGNPQRAPDVRTWAIWFSTDERRRRKQTFISEAGVEVSTVFLGIDHSFDLDSRRPELPDLPHLPILWETVIFGGEHDGYRLRHRSWAAAIAGHSAAVLLALGPPPAQATDSTLKA